MESINKEAVTKLESNFKPKYIEGVQILLKLLDNIINEPNIQKYRTIKQENEIIKSKLMPLIGLKELLLDMGFEFSNLGFTLPSTVPLANIKQYREFISNRLHIRIKFPSISEEPKATFEPQPSTSKNFDNFEIKANKPFLKRINYPKVLKMDNKFLMFLEENSDLVMQYEDPNLINTAKRLIPIEKITFKATHKLRNIQKSVKTGKNNVKETSELLDDLRLYELLEWFHTEFFKWIDVIPCKKCGEDDRSKCKYFQRNENGTLCEVNFCCDVETKFYRYNDVAKLLISRKGRCGEYANCFTFLCRAMGFEARIVHSRFDHVWTEVYSNIKKRWLHVDPSEKVIDAPLMYQHGWKRKIDYVIAYSANEIQDVTWRYTSNHKMTIKERNLCTENDLIYALNALRKKRQNNFTNFTKTYLIKRSLMEMVEFLSERNPTENEKKGRSSGYLVWRQQRGEIVQDNFYTFEANEQEEYCKQFNLRYSCTEDKYERYIKAEDKISILQTTRGWQNWTFQSKNIIRKTENDWKMVYLAREEGQDYAEISWKFDFNNSNLIIKNYSLKFDKKTFENGIVTFKLITDDGSNQIIGSNCFKLAVKLTNGIGDNAWQHTQLFRQSIKSKEFPFNLNIIFE